MNMEGNKGLDLQLVQHDRGLCLLLHLLLERFAYFRASRPLGFDDEVTLDTLTSVLHRGFFGAPVLAN